MQSIHIFLDIAKFADFQWKVADVSRTQGVRHVIYMFFGFFLREGITVPSFITVEYLWQILGRGGSFLPPPFREQPRKSLSWIGLMFSFPKQLQIFRIEASKKRHSFALSIHFYSPLSSWTCTVLKFSAYMPNSIIKIHFKNFDENLPEKLGKILMQT